MLATMEFSFREHLPFDPQFIFCLLRDDLSKVAPFIPDIERVDTLERKDDGTVAHIVRKWKAIYNVPIVARPFLKPEMLTWVDRADWDGSDHACRWTFEPPYFKAACLCSGVNRYVAAGGGTDLDSKGDLSLDLGKLPGIPKLMAGSVSRQIEKVLVRMVTPNLARLAEGVRRYLASPEGRQSLERRPGEAGGPAAC